MAAELRAAPVAVLGLVAVSLALLAQPLDAATTVATWAPGGVVLLGLLAVAAAVLPLAWRDVPRVVRLAVVLLAAWTAFSYLTILWADDPGNAWEGSNRNVLLLCAFALLALWPQGARTGLWVLGAWVGGMALLGLVVLLGLLSDPGSAFVGERLDEPQGYTNAAAAAWLMAAWPAVVLAASAQLRPAARGGAAAAAVLLAGLALLVQSRGAVFATPIVLAALLLVVPGRVRHTWALVAVAAGVAAAAPALLDGAERVGAGEPDPLGGAAVGLLLAATAVGAAVLAWALAERPGGPLRADRRAAVARLARVAAVGLAVAVAGGALVAAGNPTDRVDRAWESFKGGYEDTDAEANRLVGGLGSSRYDFYRVALDRFAEAPIGGIGTDNFFADYLQRAAPDTSETPRHPHSWELRALLQTGLVGAGLLLGFLVCVGLAARRALRGSGPLGAAVAGGALVAGVHFLAHGSVDWFFEVPGVAGPAFLLLGLVCGLVPRDRPSAPGWTLAPAPAAAGAALLAAVVLALPWAAEQDVRRAGEVFDRDPEAAYARLDRAATLDPLSERARLVEAGIALRRGELGRARTALRAVLERVPDDAAATLQLGALESSIGNGPEALALLRRAVELAPRDPLAREALAIVRDGDIVDVGNLVRAIFLRGQALTGA
jgi:hypothetical protein